MPETIVQLPDDRRIIVVQPEDIQRKIADRWRQGPEFFNIYKDMLKSIIDRWPKSTDITVPKTMAPASLVARLRDARLANSRYRYDPALADRFAEANGLTFVYDELRDVVVARQKLTRGRKGIDDVSPAIATEGISTSLRMLTTPEIEAFCLLLAHDLVKGPVFIKGAIDPTLVASLEASLNVGIDFNPETGLTTLL
jgi:hypothetical protein